MPVIDANGKLVGTVKHVHTPTPTARSSQSLLKMTGTGLMDYDSYIRAEQIESADEDQVVLSVTVTVTDLRTEDGR